MSDRRLTVPNIITVGRILATPVVAWTALSDGTGMRLVAFFVFLVAALSDLWDGYLARKHGWVTDVGKLLDPLADKLLLAVTLIPFYFISHRAGDVNHVPFWGPLPLWIVLVILGRELLITLFRSYASRRGIVIAAGKSGKYKAFLLYVLVPLALTNVSRTWVIVVAATACASGVISLGEYIVRMRGMLAQEFFCRPQEEAADARDDD